MVTTTRTPIVLNTESEIRLIEAIRNLAFGKITVHVESNKPVRLVEEKSIMLKAI